MEDQPSTDNLLGPPLDKSSVQSACFRPYIALVVENRVVDAYIDTGADLSFMSEELRQV